MIYQIGEALENFEGPGSDKILLRYQWPLPVSYHWLDSCQWFWKSIITFLGYLAKAFYSVDGFVHLFAHISIYLLFPPRSVHVAGFTVLNDSFFKVNIFLFRINDLTLGGQNLIISCLSLAAVVDVLIAIAMSFLLYRQRTGFAR